MSTQIEYNDSIMWYNADSRENVTQRIVFDADGDGLYNGSEDWDSGEIYQDCPPPSNNSSSICQESFTVWFNERGALVSTIINQFHPMAMYKTGR